VAPRTHLTGDFGAGGVGANATPGRSAGRHPRRSPSFPVIQDSALKGKLGIPEARGSRLMNRSVSCTVKNPKVEVFGYPPPSTQAGVAPFNILVGASPPRGLAFLSFPFPRSLGAAPGSDGFSWGGGTPLGLGGSPSGASSPAPRPRHPRVLLGELGRRQQGFTPRLGAPAPRRLRPREGVGVGGSRCAAGGGSRGAAGAARRWGCLGGRG